MKKIIALLAVVGMFSLQGCTTTDPNYVDHDTIAEVFELKNQNFYNDPNDFPDEGYTIYQKLTPNIYPSDVVLIYRLSGTLNSGSPIWQLIPRTLFLSQGELDYDFDFSKEDFTIYAGGTYILALTPQYLNNQTFRIVIVPGSQSGSAKLANKNNFSDYNAVIKKYNIDESNIKILN
jgi:hypothetical protein